MPDHLVAAFAAERFFRPEAKRPAMAARIRNLFHRAPLASRDGRAPGGAARPRLRRNGPSRSLRCGHIGGMICFNSIH
ncbi:MAG: hypothetical protein RQ752_01380 [Thermohalobaculum sp.]|nr:hypothetical protein [Thermohalobaculum sp.]